jgi:hypothetical protein
VLSSAVKGPYGNRFRLLLSHIIHRHCNLADVSVESYWFQRLEGVFPLYKTNGLTVMDFTLTPLDFTLTPLDLTDLDFTLTPLDLTDLDFTLTPLDLNLTPLDLNLTAL